MAGVIGHCTFISCYEVTDDLSSPYSHRTVHGIRWTSLSHHAQGQHARFRIKTASSISSLFCLFFKSLAFFNHYCLKP
ncbi:hypothetical protein LEMLEM_LOCUS10159 [Lemmus lemmus]